MNGPHINESYSKIKEIFKGLSSIGNNQEVDDRMIENHFYNNHLSFTFTFKISF